MKVLNHERLVVLRSVLSRTAGRIEANRKALCGFSGLCNRHPIVVSKQMLVLSEPL